MTRGGALERARAGDPGAFAELARAHCAALAAAAADEEAFCEALVVAFRELPAFDEAEPLERWLVARLARRGAGVIPDRGTWSRLAAALALEAPALAGPALPERRFPVVPRLGRSGRTAPPRRPKRPG